jgi:regulator of sirC expression with transglutaminase-like and TPR domain
VDAGFRGNQDDYYDRRNSFLNEVLDRRSGIPITLAVVYIEVARRLGIVLLGVGFPGHFLAKQPGSPELIVDPFFGQILSQRDCEQRLKSVLGSAAQLEPSHLDVASPREMLVRMLRNLKQIYLRAHELEPALACSERILLVEPSWRPSCATAACSTSSSSATRRRAPTWSAFWRWQPDDPTAAAVRQRPIDIGRHGATLH